MIDPNYKPPTLDTAPNDLAHAPEVPHHRFSMFHEAGNFAYARGLEVNPTHLPLALDAMAKSGWHLLNIFGQTDSVHVGFIFRRGGLDWETEARLRSRIDDLLHANNGLVEQRRAAMRRVEHAFLAGWASADGGQDGRYAVEGEETSMKIREGTRTKRCDLCRKWGPYSDFRIMGWCKAQGPVPEEFAKMDGDPVIALALRGCEETTAYNDVCDSFERITE